jgi:hypothetical protein
VVHPKAPFGVVSMEMETEGRELSGEGAVSIKAMKTLTLVETGKNAVSDLPKGSGEKSKQ